jgi:ABC-2 type transport system permease protein
MRWSRIWAITRKQFSTLRHDHRSLGLMLVAPVMAMLIFGFAFGSEPKHVPVVIVNHDQGTMASELIKQLDGEALDIEVLSDHPSDGFIADASPAKDDVRQGKKVGVIVFGESFTKDSTPSGGGVNPVTHKLVPPTPAKGAHIQVFLDTTNQQLAGVVPRELGQAAQDLAKSKGVSPMAIDTDYAFPKAKDARYIDYFVPGVMAFAITLFTTLLTLLAFVGERTSGTLDRLRSTPVTEAEIVLGYELAFGTIAAVQGLLILIVAVLVYHVLIVGPVVLAALLIILTAIDAQAIGILVSAAAKREGQAVQFIPFIVFPVFLLSGIFVAVQSLPGWLQPFSFALPPTWAIEGLRDVLLRGWGLEHVWVHLTVLAGFAVVFTVLAIFGLTRSRA